MQHSLLQMAQANDYPATQDDFPPLGAFPLKREETTTCDYSDYPNYNPYPTLYMPQGVVCVPGRGEISPQASAPAVRGPDPEPTDEQKPDCLCGKRCATHQIKKADSANVGKWFFVCAKRRGDPTTCPFWQLQGGPAWKPADPAPFNVTCDCRKQAIIVVVKKPGKNQGRKCYTCGTKQCAWFRWAPANA